jgi:hypothetical protein
MMSRISNWAKDLRNRIDVWWWYNHHRVLRPLKPLKHVPSILFAILSAPLWPLTVLVLATMSARRAEYDKALDRCALGITWGIFLYCALAGYCVGHLLVSYLVA